MMTVKEVSRLSGVSVRTLHHYDRIGLLRPSGVSEAGYRLYDEDALLRLQHILLFKALEFPLREIKAMMDSPDFDQRQALEQQIELLTMKKEHLDNLILFAKGLKLKGMKNLNFSAFDTQKLDEYADRAKTMWKDTDAWKEYEHKSKGRTKQQEQLLAGDIMDIFRRFGEIKDTAPEGEAAQALVGELQAFITTHLYNCTPQILSYLADSYDGGGDFTVNIDKVGGDGAAAFAAAATRIYLKQKG